MPQSRAKFRVLSITENLDCFEVTLKPVTKKAGGNFPENEAFWRWTPSGEAKLVFVKDKPLKFAVGDFYYLDFDQDLLGEWNLTRLETWGSSADGAGSARFYRGHGTGPDKDFIWGELVVQLSGGSTKTADFSPINSNWKIEFKFAHKSEE